MASYIAFAALELIALARYTDTHGLSTLGAIVVAAFLAGMLVIGAYGVVAARPRRAASSCTSGGLRGGGAGRDEVRVLIRQAVRPIPVAGQLRGRRFGDCERDPDPSSLDRDRDEFRVDARLRVGPLEVGVHPRVEVGEFLVHALDAFIGAHAAPPNL
jgi:hypothetical protein